MATVELGHTAPLQHPDKLYIGGKWVTPSTDRMIDVIAPATEQVFARVAEAMEADMVAAVTAARHAFDHGPWPRMTHGERAGYIRRIARLLDERAPDTALIWPNEMGMTHKIATASAARMGGIYDFYAGLADTYPWEEPMPSTVAAQALLVREPVGVVGAIIPWNGPMSLIAYKVAPALVAGCTVVIKASPEAPGHALMMAEIAEAAGLPPGVINVVTADREASEAMVRNPSVDKIAFTGSSAAGKRIASLMGDRIGRYTLELGGKSAAIILDDYDIQSAADALGGAICALTGQVCAALSRVIVPRDRHDEMVEALAARFAKVVVGDPFDPVSDMGPLAMRRQRDRVEHFIGLGRDAGYRIAAGGKRPAHLERGFYVEPTVFSNVDNNAAIAREEIFGPVLAVIPADSETHAIEIANDSPYGLNGAVFTNDVDRAYAAARQVRSGTVGHNGLKTDFGIAFGGFKESGVGREGGVEGLKPYLELKTMLLDGTPSHLK